mmetsp:Transcript_13373/g.23679  ORF Transcript_13373/g.23679 Transcript_13373/m.23679 type:complete len:1466 (-) Transcript_13373:839-5236(-)|eukprot:CAMPEP_0175054154 /NCGR_PEP_ID=MMETSP0052_2-20121109/9343_1 /TAXON_ID=51329 ORGANISM="Polytomella parva, Strain SAG 63-3" /NCGR_SAMPLE_ID=MMETSP0052_2 /ASSEMBLY_ACC=CAM_ASM_000194 /LENGTH=1465 /DNA_ID=CAMNT_0016318809 /DNA_START=163 /DNA_END=4560 /DNA_ORIENTATION=+
MSETKIDLPITDLKDGKPTHYTTALDDDDIIEAKNEINLEEITKEDSSDEQIKPLNYFALYINGDRLDNIAVILATIGAIANGALLPCFSILFGEFTDAFGHIDDRQHFIHVVKHLSLQFLCLGLGAFGAAYMDVALWTWSGNRQTSRLNQKYLRSILNQDIAFFDTSKTGTGGLLQGLNQDSVDVQMAISEKVGQLLKHTSTFIAGFVIAFTKGWDMTLVMIGCVPFMMVIGGMMAKVMATTAQRSNASYAQASMVAQQSILQVRTIYSYVQEKRMTDEYEESLDVPLRVGIFQGLVMGLIMGGLQVVVYATFAIALVYGAWRVKSGHYTGGQVMAVLVSVFLGGFAIGQGAPHMQHLVKGCVSGARMFNVINRKPEIIIDTDDGITLPEVKGELCFEHVKFAYPARPELPVFEDFSIEIPSGKTVALVGSSGSGKSTVVGLLERFYDPYSGTITLDGVDIRKLNLRWMRNIIGLVSQEPTLFATTVYENIAMGKPGATREEVLAAAHAANAFVFIDRLPEKFDTQVGERGTQMSGGQKQRIAIARAILKNPKILLLDEATSALDTASERLVQAALDRMVIGRTTVVVAHRLSTIRTANIISVLVNGKMVEQGSHDDLIGRPNGAYAALVNLQLQHSKETAKKGGSGNIAVEEEEEGERGDEDELENDVNRGVVKGDDANKDSGRSPFHSGAQEGSVQDADDTSDKQRIVIAGQGSGRVGSGRVGSGAHPCQPSGHTKDPLIEDVEAGEGSDSMKIHNRREGGDTGDKQKRCFGGLFGKKVCSEDKCDRGNKVTPGDKGKGKNKSGDNAVMTIEEVEAIEASKVDMSFKRLAKMNYPEWKLAITGIFSSLILGAVNPAFSFLFASMIKIFYYTDYDYMRSQASFYAGMFIVIGGGSFVAYIGQMYSFTYMGQQLARRVRQQLFRAFLVQEVGWFDRESNNSGQLTSLLSTDATYVRGAVADVVGLTIQNLATVVVGYILAFIYDYRMALLVTGILPFMVFAQSVEMKYMTGFSSGADKINASSNQTASESIAAVRVVQSYNMQDAVMDRYENMMKSATKEVFRRALVMGFSAAFAAFMMFASYSLIIYFGGYEIYHGWVVFDHMLKSFMAILFAAMGMAQASAGFGDIGKAKGAVNRIFPIIDRKPLIQFNDAETEEEEGENKDGQKDGPAQELVVIGGDKRSKNGNNTNNSRKATATDTAAVGISPPKNLKGYCPTELKGDISFRNVDFAYPSRPSIIVFKNFSMEITAGMTMALVGESGSGKSTVIGMIERFYDCLRGEVLIDGINIQKYNLRWLRRHIGLVSQEPLLFTGTIAENISFGVADASLEEIVAAAEAANARPFIERLPEQYNAKVGEGGIQLSGGQKQRIAIARAVLKNPRVMLLDEATSALDARSEAVVQVALDRIMKGRTSIVVAHRLTTIRNADCISVVFRGKVLEQGHHDKLMQNAEGAYAKLVQAQQGH